MNTFFKDQYSKIAWRRVAVIAFVWTVFSMQGQRFKNNVQAVAYGVGHGGAAIVLLAVTGAVSTQKLGGHG